METDILTVKTFYTNFLIFCCDCLIKVIINTFEIYKHFYNFDLENINCFIEKKKTEFAEHEQSQIILF